MIPSQALPSLPHARPKPGPGFWTSNLSKHLYTLWAVMYHKCNLVLMSIYWFTRSFLHILTTVTSLRALFSLIAKIWWSSSPSHTILATSQQSMVSMTNQQMMADYEQPLIIFSWVFFQSPNTHQSLAENQLENVFWSATTCRAIA